MKKLLVNDKYFYWVLGVSAAVIPLPGNNFSSISIILLLIVWMFYQSFSAKGKSLKENIWDFSIMILPFVLVLLGLLYTDNREEGIKKVQLCLPFFVYPLILFSTKLDNKASPFVLYCFSFGTFIASLIGIIYALSYRFMGLGDYFFNEKFSELLDKHTTYFSLFVVISMLFILSESIKRRLNWKISIPVLFYFIGILYVVSTRISLVALSASIIILVFMEIKSKLKWLGIIIPFFLIGLFSMPNFQKRFEPSDTEIGQISDLEFRKYHWLSVWETLQENPIIFGNGTGASRDFLYETYKKHQLTSAYELEYNAHNQYLEYALDFGLLGVVVLGIILVYIIIRFYRSGNYLALAVIFTFIIYFLTESLLQRHDGIVTFSLLMSLFLTSRKIRT